MSFVETSSWENNANGILLQVAEGIKGQRALPNLWCFHYGIQREEHAKTITLIK